MIILPSQVADWAELHHMGNAMAAAAFEASNGEDYYKIGTAADLQYLASGGSDDWARGVAGIKYIFLKNIHRKLDFCDFQMGLLDRTAW